MSRSNPTPTNPATKLFRWAGSEGKLTWYDRETKQRVEAKLPFKMLVLDELHTIGGFSEPHKSAIWSNEIKQMSDHLIVRTAAGQIATGTYEDIKNELKAQGGKYARSVYIAFKDGDSTEWQIGNFKVTGAALGAWFDFKRSNNVEVDATILTGSTKDKKGSNEYFVPTFASEEVTDEEGDAAIALDTQLQNYLAVMIRSKAVVALADPIDEQEVAEEQENKGTDPIDLSEIPF